MKATVWSAVAAASGREAFRRGVADSYANRSRLSFVHRVIAYRSFEIHVELTPAAQETFDVTFQIKGRTNLEVLGARGGRIPLRNGPFTERWAYLVAEIAGQAAIDVLLGPVD